MGYRTSIGTSDTDTIRLLGHDLAGELLGQIGLGLGFLAVSRKDWATAREEFERVVQQYPDTEAGPEALYWAGVAKYSASHDATELKSLGRQFKERYTDTAWAKRASIW